MSESCYPIIAFDIESSSIVNLLKETNSSFIPIQEGVMV